MKTGQVSVAGQEKPPFCLHKFFLLTIIGLLTINIYASETKSNMSLEVLELVLRYTTSSKTNEFHTPK